LRSYGWEWDTAALKDYAFIMQILETSNERNTRLIIETLGEEMNSALIHIGPG
jgi:hypothetical protein